MKFRRDPVSRFTLAALSLAVSGFCIGARADVVYSSLPTLGPSPTNVASYGYEANQLSEVGDHVALAAGGRDLQSVTVTMSDFALAASYPQLTGTTYAQSLTLNLYAYSSSGIAGGVIGTDTITALVPFRPAEDSTCPFMSGAFGYHDSTGACQNGIAFDVTFDFSALGITLPDDFVFGLAFNTENYGAAPTGTPGPYNSLNFGAPTTGATIGTDVNPDATYFRVAGGDFVEETGSGPNVVAAQFVTTAAVPEPSSIALMGLALASMAGVTRRKRRARK